MQRVKTDRCQPFGIKLGRLYGIRRLFFRFYLFMYVSSFRLCLKREMELLLFEFLELKNFISLKLQWLWMARVEIYTM